MAATVAPSVLVFDPRFLTWARWSALMVQAHVEHSAASIAQPVPESRWRDWAALFVGQPGRAGNNLPRPAFFRTWRDWAYAVNHVLWTVGD